ncbi:MAG: adenine phosphoribosyltransferase [Nitrospirae bacterium]|nr:MAG: adenine phosphoribosyltransferase [Nitrospirota bacterium]
MQDYKAMIREVPDFPQPGILFYDITPLLKEPTVFQHILDDFVRKYDGMRIDKIVGIESRGFIFGSPLAYRLNAGFVPVRKPGKLPADVYEVKYNLEYGSNSLAIHRDAIVKGEHVLVVDDLLATGGTAAATVHLIRQLGGEIVEVAFLVELRALGGRQRLNGCPVFSLITYD